VIDRCIGVWRCALGHWVAWQESLAATEAGKSLAELPDVNCTRSLRAVGKKA
jgi:hypothetical protein